MEDIPDELDEELEDDLEEEDGATLTDKDPYGAVERENCSGLIAPRGYSND